MSGSTSARAGPGGQNVNKVASKAVLTWNHFVSPLLSDRAKPPARDAVSSLSIVKDVGVQISSQKHRDQDRNKQDCLEKLQEVLAEARTEAEGAAARPGPREAPNSGGSTPRNIAAPAKASRKEPRED